jgi:transposase-like protein
MSSEATHRTEAAQKRNTPAPYWTFFTTDDWAFWNFVDRSRDDAKTQRRCFRAVDMLPSHRRRDIPSGVRGVMITQVLHCPYCNETDIVRHGKSPEGKQRYRCRQCLEGRGRTFLLEYAYAGQSPAVKQQIVDMAMNASGIRDTARVLHVSPTTVIKELKKRNLHSSK